MQVAENGYHRYSENTGQKIDVSQNQHELLTRSQIFFIPKREDDDEILEAATQHEEENDQNMKSQSPVHFLVRHLINLLPIVAPMTPMLRLHVRS